jgi:ADP-heptose:LPS heptosyltransferase
VPKILVLRYSAIGDIVLTSPVLRCLYQQLPNCEIHVATKQGFAIIHSANPYIYKVHCLDDSLWEHICSLRQHQFDFVVDLHHNQRTFIIKNALTKPSKSFPKLNIEKWLLVNFKINKMPNLHIVDRYFEAVAGLGIKNDHAGLDFFIDPNNEIDLQVFFQQTEKQPYIALVLGATYATKALLTAQLIALCNTIKLPTVLLGGKAEMPTAQAIVQACAKNANLAIFNACGILNLHQSASVLRQAHKVITHDTGLMHIAAAFKKPMFTIWGNTVPGFGMYPYYPEAEQHLYQISEVAGLPCRPCSKLGYSACPKKHFNCMLLQNLPQITSWANE